MVVDGRAGQPGELEQVPAGPGPAPADQVEQLPSYDEDGEAAEGDEPVEGAPRSTTSALKRWAAAVYKYSLFGTVTDPKITTRIMQLALLQLEDCHWFKDFTWNEVAFVLCKRKLG